MSWPALRVSCKLSKCKLQAANCWRRYPTRPRKRRPCRWCSCVPYPKVRTLAVPIRKFKQTGVVWRWVSEGGLQWLSKAKGLEGPSIRNRLGQCTLDRTSRCDWSSIQAWATCGWCSKSGTEEGSSLCGKICLDRAFATPSAKQFQGIPSCALTWWPYTLETADKSWRR